MASETTCRPSGKRPYRMRDFRIWDTNQKTFYMRDNQLIAGYLQGANIKLEEKIGMLPLSMRKVFLGLRGGKLCLSCVKSGNDAKLQLEEVDIAELMKKKEQDLRFIFFLSEEGPTTRFESAACPGWFLGTEQEADQPVGFTQATEESVMITRFYLQEDQ